MSVTFVNEYLGLAQGPIDHNASTVINAICGDENLAIGDIVRELPSGTGIGFTQSDDLLPRIGKVDEFGGEGYGVIVGGDFEGVYSNGVIDTADLSSGIIVSFFGDGVRVCIQGRCLALANGALTNPIEIGDALTPSPTGLADGLNGDQIFARALETTSVANSIIPVDIQREGNISGESTAFKKELTVLAADVTGASPLTAFPLLVSIVDTDLRDFARPDGFDIFFTESDGTTVIPYDRESYDNTTGTLAAWVLTTLSDVTDNTFFMFYGDPLATDKQNPLPVWSTRFADVFHFNDTSPLPWTNSSTGKNFTFNPDGPTNPTPVVGQIGVATNSDRGASPATIVAFRMTPTVDVFPTDFFVSAWVKYDVIAGAGSSTFYNTWASNLPIPVVPLESGVIISSGVEGDPIPNTSIALVIDDSGFTEIAIGDMSDLAYHHVAFRYLSGTFEVFFDGVSISSTPYVFTTAPNFDAAQSGGGGGSVNQIGRVDQLQVAYTGSFSNGFVTTSYDNQKDSGQGAGNFVKVGPQEPGT